MQRLVSLLLVFAFLMGAVSGSSAQPTEQFDILGASLDVRVARGGVTLPATLVPYLKPGDVVEISFPAGVQFSSSPRWHLVVANMYDDYLQHQPWFPIADANLSRAKPGAVWKFTVKDGVTPIVFLVPENGNRRGHGIPDARHAIAQLANRALLLRTATLSANAQAKESTMDLFLQSLASIKPNALPDGRAHVIAATQSLFGYDLGSSACFGSDLPQSTQFACAAQAVATNYDNASKADVVTAVGSQLPVAAATYGMLAGALYELLAKRHVDADYLFAPGAIEPGARSTNVYVAQQPSYDASAGSPSTIVYFEIGSRATSPRLPSYGEPPALSLCLDGDALDVAMPFDGLPIYFRSHEAVIRAGDRTFDAPMRYDALTGYHGTLSREELAALKGGGSVRIESAWGFDTLLSGPARIVEPHAAAWSLESGDDLVMGAKTGTLTFTDNGAGVGSCVESVAIKDSTGAAIPVTSIDRSNDSIAVQLDPAAALGPAASAVVAEANGITSAAVNVDLFPPLPQVTRATAYLPKGTLVLQGSGLKYIDTVTLDHTGIVFGAGTPNGDGSWTFTAHGRAAYEPSWEHETMAISYTLEPPDARSASVQADVLYQP